jgi:hypothetical protein
MGWKLLGHDPIPPFSISVAYEDIEGTQYSSSQVIDVRELEHQPANEPPLSKIEKHLNKISSGISGATSGQRPINVRTETKSEFKAEMDKVRAERDARRKEQ